jgi:hypothetical protein
MAGGRAAALDFLSGAPIAVVRGAWAQVTVILVSSSVTSTGFQVLKQVQDILLEVMKMRGGTPGPIGGL